jgi:pathogenesis-related protein 1
MGTDDMGTDDMGTDDMGTDDMDTEMDTDDMDETDWHLEPHGDTSALAQTETGGHPPGTPAITTSTQTPTGGVTTEGPLGGETTQTPTGGVTTEGPLGGETTQTPTPTPGTNAQQTFRIENTTGSAQGDDFATTTLEIHNRERAVVGVPPLTWNNTLAADAQVYANYLAATGQFHHPTQEWVDAHPTGPEGENLAAQFGGGPLNGTQLANMATGFWMGEKPLYHGQPIAASLAPGEKTFGHYSQMVWKSTTSVGCASATNSATGFIVVSCRYSPPGNVVGQTPY